MRLLPALMLLALLAAPAAGQPRPDSLLAAHARVYDRQGNPATLNDIVQAAGRADVVLVGETHDDPAAHALEAYLWEQVAAGPRPAVLSLEMFERDVQLVLDEYLGGLITEAHFLMASRPWPNYGTDYRPLVELARAKKLPVVAANAPRRYVNRTARLGPASLQALSPAARAWLPPLPVAEPSAAYRARWERVMGGAADSSAQPSPHGPSGPAYMLEAQALWDAAMAHSIATALAGHPGAVVLHVAGTFHVEGGTGLAEHLAQYRPGARTLTVIARPADRIDTFDPTLRGLGDYIVLTDAALPRTRQN